MDKMIFVVDDNDSNLTTAALALEDYYNVLTMPSAIKMFSLLKKIRPDLIILDIEMPEMTGLEAIAKLKESPEWKDIPVLFITGHNEDSILSTARESGAHEIIRKPIVASTLRDYVKKHI